MERLKLSQAGIAQANPVFRDVRVLADQYQWMLQTKAGVNKKTGEVIWKTLGYYGTLARLAEVLLEYCVKHERPEVKNLAELPDVVRQSTEIVLQALNTLMAKETAPNAE